MLRAGADRSKAKSKIFAAIVGGYLLLTSGNIFVPPPSDQRHSGCVGLAVELRTSAPPGSEERHGEATTALGSD
jgi:hypothetical protein